MSTNERNKEYSYTQTHIIYGNIGFKFITNTFKNCTFNKKIQTSFRPINICKPFFIAFKISPNGPETEI